MLTWLNGCLKLKVHNQNTNCLCCLYKITAYLGGYERSLNSNTYTDERELLIDVKCC